ncbi:DUF3975 family protein [Bacillus sp. Xin]|uniref:DUF3975 family protein n=1 Tax=unclassified Bacillus (in: firmicutes) TaxID=185979 RepID=UPI001572A77F|nr:MULTISPECIES: DUF3975 family protein [unclassified Bacillus (in: firmicutes)]MBC6974427.1 DUF3975 family protein [Bacillus sp. Xin]NSW34787.1 DUF3975 family protein [Bacillus sp. Xin1]
MWKEKGKQLLTGILIGMVILLQMSFHVIEGLFHKVISVLTFLPNMALEVVSIVWSIIASITIIIVWSIAKLWNKITKKDSSSEKK